MQTWKIMDGFIPVNRPVEEVLEGDEGAFEAKRMAGEHPNKDSHETFQGIGDLGTHDLVLVFNRHGGIG